MSKLTQFQQQAEFMDACDLRRTQLGVVDRDATLLAKTLVQEEINETMAALAQVMIYPSTENLVELADGIVDSVYVLFQLANTLGIPFDECFAEVHRSNMSKVMANGKVLKRPDGKVMKPEGWTPPNLWKILTTEIAHQSADYWNRKSVPSSEAPPHP